MSLVDDMERYEQDDEWHDQIAAIAEKYEAEIAQLRARVAELELDCARWKDAVEGAPCHGLGCGSCSDCVQLALMKRDEARARHKEASSLIDHMRVRIREDGAKLAAVEEVERVLRRLGSGYLYAADAAADLLEAALKK